MNLSRVFIERPVATTLLTIGVALAGILAFLLLPVSPLPNIDVPTIIVNASMAGASPETMANSVATPLERHLGQIAAVTEMTSSSQLGNTRVILQFDISRDIDGAARDVQAAINAARVDLPASLRSNPTYRKVNPSDRPVIVLAMTSKVLTQGQLYDSAATVLQQKLSQVKGVGQVEIWGSSLPAVRVELNPMALAHYGVGMESVRSALSSANANSPKGSIAEGESRFQIYTNDQARTAGQFRDLIIAYREGAPIRLRDIATVTDSVEDLRNMGECNGSPSVLLAVEREPGANIVETADRVKALLPELQADCPASVDLHVVMDRTTTIRASLRDVERTLMASVILVVLVVWAFLHDWRATLIPAVAVPISLLGTFAAMYLLNYTIDNFSLMSLTIATGFVVDDAIVVLENTVRHVEEGMDRLTAALRGAREVGFTVISMSLSLVAVFLPILLMGGIQGLMLREFAVTLSVAILISLIVSLTTTPMLCATALRAKDGSGHRTREGRVFSGLRRIYGRSLAFALRHPRLVLVSLGLTVGLNIWLYIVIPKGFFPEQDTGLLFGGVVGDASISFQLMEKKMRQFMDIVRSDPAVDTVVGFAGGRGTSSGFTFISLKPLSERKASAREIVNRLRRPLMHIAGASMWMAVGQDFHAGGRSSNASYQYTLQCDDLDLLTSTAKRLTAYLSDVPELADVNSDLQDKGLETDLIVDREAANRYQLQESQVDNTLYDAFGQRQVSTIFNPLNQYHVVMEVDPKYWQDPTTLKYLYVSTAGGAVRGSSSTNAPAGTVVAAATAKTRQTNALSAAADSARNAQLNALANTSHGAASTGAAVSSSAETMVPLSAISHFGPGTIPQSINHQELFAAVTISFNLPIGTSLGQAQDAIERAMAALHISTRVHGSMQGTAKLYQKSQSNQLLLILAAIFAIYIVLGILYESYIHPITILSTLPSAGVGALLALILFNTELSLIALIGVFLLIGLVKKNAIMMVDVALDSERTYGLRPREAIFRACMLRLRPIMMTTMVAMFGAVPLMIAVGEGSELRQPLGLSIVGGLAISQLLTLFTTPVVYLGLDRLRRRRGRPQPLAEPSATPLPA